ncbi:hypothetical protein [Actinoplanes sp. M2I2]|uniref:hypothetical protein n=1 Tax=Actinoplanes sp. M2I2 TaxID=1734444 RepID=UPI0020228555|nr:hypothetical protein [Actinoplanes sp. M2I2]
MTDRDLAEFDIPVPQDFVQRVQRGVRRRRLLRAAATGGATLTVAGVVVGGLALAQGGSQQAPVTPPAAASSGESAAAGSALDGFAISSLPQGVVRAGEDSFYTARVTDKGLVNDGTGPGLGDPSASVTMRRYDRTDGASFFVTVMRPMTGDAATVGAQLVTGATAGVTPAVEFDTSIGTARMFRSVGNEITTYRAVVETPEHVVITVEGSGKARAAEIQDMARNIAR